MILRGDRVQLRPATLADQAEVVRMRTTPEIFARWRGDDHAAEFVADLEDDETVLLMIETHDGAVIGLIQFAEETDPDYRHAGIDLYVDPAVHRRGYGVDAIRTLTRHLFEDRGHHRITIDPAADNAAAIACYAKVGFQRVGVMRQYERHSDGTWHDGLLMELLRAP